MIGIVAGLAALAFGAHARIVEGTLEIGGGALGRAIDRAPAPLRFAAITLGHVIIGVDERSLEHCRCHERVHVAQYERWGMFFFPAYAIASLYEWARGNDPYRDNVFEREARGEPRISKSPP